jgi:hypothetical protein
LVSGGRDLGHGWTWSISRIWSSCAFRDECDVELCSDCSRTESLFRIEQPQNAFNSNPSDVAFHAKVAVINGIVWPEGNTGYRRQLSTILSGFRHVKNKDTLC